MKSKAERNRKLMPNVVELLDEIGFAEMKERLGARVIAAEDFETGFSQGRFESSEEEGYVVREIPDRR